MSEDKVIKLGAKREKNAEHAHHEHRENHDELVYCSFCGRPNTQVLKMVQGPGVNICSECAMIAVQYLSLIHIYSRACIIYKRKNQRAF